MKTLLTILLLAAYGVAIAQQGISGRTIDEYGSAIGLANVTIWQKDSLKKNTETGNDGRFAWKSAKPGHYYIQISHMGYEVYEGSFDLSDTGTAPGDIVLRQAGHMLSEVSVVEKVLAMVQKDDTIEYNSGAYKVNPDADASDLARKMPGIQLNDKQITAQGETVVKVLVDGKPFFGNDPYAALKNLPSDIIDKIQVYNEKSDQERFTGFSEGNTSKTINIVTKPNKRKGVFGSLYAGYGQDNNNEGIYGTGATLNQFDNERRITFTGQANNINVQNFSADNASSVSGGSGTAETKAAGINYSDKWGKKINVSGSYFFNGVNSSVSRSVQKTYLLSADSGQVYNEVSPSANENFSHRVSLRINYALDSLNSILWTPALTVNKRLTTTSRDGNTHEGGQPVNSLVDGNRSTGDAINFSGNLLLRHKFRKPHRTLSVSMNTSANTNNGDSRHTSQSTFYASPALNDTLDQSSTQNQNTWSIAGNVTYTEPVQKNGILKMEYTMSYVPAHSERNTYDYSAATGAYTMLNDQYSNSFYSGNTAHKGGISYQGHTTRSEFSFGINYQLTQLRNDQAQPYEYHLKEAFRDVLPTATFHYKLSKTRNLQCTYNTNTQVPSVSQLQDVVNNTDPLHLYAGNPSLKQPYQHNLTVRYSATGNGAKNTFSLTMTGSYVQRYVTSGSYIAPNDTVISHNIPLARGSQLTVPVNTDGYAVMNSYISYGLPLSKIKCHLNLNANAGLATIPSVINNTTNYQYNKTGGGGTSLGSNISEHVDFILSSNISVVATDNSINKQTNTTYYNTTTSASVNLLLWKGIVFTSSVNYRSNKGLAAGYDQNYTLWNLSIGKKFFKRQQGDLRISGYDLLNENSNIQHSVTDIYIQDCRSNIVQRYFLLVFTYKIREFSNKSTAGSD